jgi:glucokinase
VAIRVKPSPPLPHRITDLAIIDELISELLCDNHPVAVGISFGGPVDHSQGVVRLSHHVPGWENFAICSYYQEKLNIPVFVDNDANVAALSEWAFGAGVGKSSLLYLTISTGVGGGIILDGRIWHGMDSMAGEIGHMTIDPQGPVCLCGKRGCVERLASGPYLADDARTILREYPEKGTILRHIVLDELEKITAREIGQAASQGDDLSVKLVKRAGIALGIGIGNTANLLNPECFVLGGGVIAIGDLLMQAIVSSARQTALPEVKLNIYPTALGNFSPLSGAVALAQANLVSIL